jgi:hypothetical protein
MWLKAHDVCVLLIKSLVEQSNIRSKLAVEDDDIQFLLEMIYDSSFPESQVRLSLYLTFIICMSYQGHFTIYCKGEYAHLALRREVEILRDCITA